MLWCEITPVRNEINVSFVQFTKYKCKKIDIKTKYIIIMYWLLFTYEYENINKYPL